MLSRKLDLEGAKQFSVPDTSGPWPPSWHTRTCLVPKHPLCFPLRLAAGWPPGDWRGHHFHPFGTVTRQAGSHSTQAAWHASWEPWPSLPVWSQASGPLLYCWWKGVGSGKVAFNRRERLKALGREVSRSCSGADRKRCVLVSWGKNSGLTAELILLYKHGLHLRFQSLAHHVCK